MHVLGEVVAEVRHRLRRPLEARQLQPVVVVVVGPGARGLAVTCPLATAAPARALAARGGGVARGALRGRGERATHRRTERREAGGIGDGAAIGGRSGGDRGAGGRGGGGVAARGTAATAVGGAAGPILDHRGGAALLVVVLPGRNGGDAGAGERRAKGATHGRGRQVGKRGDAGEIAPPSATR